MAVELEPGYGPVTGTDEGGGGGGSDTRLQLTNKATPKTIHVRHAAVYAILHEPVTSVVDTE